MNLKGLLSDNADYIKGKGRFRVILTKIGRNDGVTWYSTLSIAPAEVAPTFRQYLLDANLAPEFVTMVMEQWEADVGSDGPSMITFRAYAPEDYVI